MIDACSQSVLGVLLGCIEIGPTHAKLAPSSEIGNYARLTYYDRSSLLGKEASIVFWFMLVAC
jgi:hypothetical protein